MNHFVHQPYVPGETIAAIATPPGSGGVAVIRISGNDARAVAAKTFSGPIQNCQSHTVHYGLLCNRSGAVVDEVLAIAMDAPRSFTGENVVEIHCHGGSIVSRKVLETVLDAGARHARAGEFTFRAFINGKIDLTQAEAIQELIAAKNEKAADAAQNNLHGSLSKRIAAFQQQLTGAAAILEAWVDFPEEDLEFTPMETFIDEVEATLQAMKELLATYHDGRIVHEGVTLSFVGSPNVGKSSLMNALLERDRAIVSPIAGTTRDIVEDHWRLNGLNIKLTDTAGIRSTDEIVEVEGIRRSRVAMEQSDVVILVLDRHRGLGDDDHGLIDSVPKGKTVVAWNKEDLAAAATTGVLPPLPMKYVVSLSAKAKTGIDALKEAIDKVIWEKGPPSQEEVVITNARHKEALAEACQATERLVNGLKSGISPEFLSMEMRQVLQALGRIIGSDITDDILTAIFSRFCIGK